MKSITTENKILLIFPEGNASNNPTIRSIIDLLAEKQITTDIFTRKTKSPQAQLPSTNWINETKTWWLLRAIAANILCSNTITAILMRLRHAIRPFDQYKLIIGVDRQGLIEAHSLSNITNAPYGFISFEIMFEKETSARFKHPERIASSKASFWITQDEERADRLQFENHLKKDNLFILPVSSKSKKLASGKRLRDALKIPPEKKVAIYIGSISSWTMIDDIIDTVPSWPKEWVLVIHDRYGATEEKISHLKTKPNNGLQEQLYISNNASDDIDDMDFVLGGVNCGLAFYQPIDGDPFLGDNIRHIGKSSGKISTYFRYGIPVITNITGPLANTIKEKSLGKIMINPDALPQYLATPEISTHGKNCHAFFEQELDFKIYANRLFELIEKNSLRSNLGS